MDINFFVVSDFESAPFIADGWDEYTFDSNWEGYREAYTKLMGECLSEGSEMRVASVTLDDAVIDSLKDTPQAVNDHVGSSSERLVYLVIVYPTCSYGTRRECSVLQGGGESPGLRWGGSGSRCTASTRRWVPRRPIQRSRSQTRAASHASSAAPVRGTPGAYTGWTPL